MWYLKLNKGGFMKKIALLISILTISGIANAYPAPDMTEGGSPFLLIQQMDFERNELKDLKMNEDYRNQGKKQSPKFQLQSYTEQTQDVPDAKEMQLIEQDGHIIIKSISH